MSKGMMALGVLMFAAAAAVLYVWGLKKSMDQEDELRRRLMSACGSRVVKHLKKHGTVTANEVAGLIDGMTSGQFWSRHKIRVEDGKAFSGQVIAFLLDQQYIRSTGSDRYELRK